MLDPSTEVSFMLSEQLAPDNLARWVSAGYDEADTQAFMTATQAALLNPNTAMEPRLPGSLAYRYARFQGVGFQGAGFQGC